jgi:EAL domain-containing protein (putative c-di-GMP-specific phosphodiesterase class I)
MPRAKRVGVLIAEDDPSVREALSALILSEPRLKLLGTAADTDEAISLATKMQPDVAILDVRMPHGGGARAARELKRCSPETKLLALSGADDRATVLEMLEAGVVGYLVKGGAMNILDTIDQVTHGQSSLSVEVTGDVIEELVQQLGAQRRQEARLKVKRSRIERAIEGDDALRIVGQPICSLDGLETVGMEALARFAGPPKRGPDRWFAEASQVGRRTELELVAAARALARLDELPPTVYLAVNVSPTTLATPAFRRLLAATPPSRVVIEITEHAPIDDYEKLNAILASMRANGVRLAIDDAGAGFASLRHILRLEPDFIKLDITLVEAVEHDGSQQALAAGLISFSESIGAEIVAEGIETAEALAALRRLGVGYGQGYLLGRPEAELDVARARAVAV